jgi:membrane-associated protease RseP (regulator of RpoE activity)
MRRLHALLVLGGLMAAPASAVAGPDQKNPDEPWTETFEWSMSTGRARLGVMVVGITPELRKHFGAPEDRGVMIGRIEKDSAAAAAGLAVGDIVTEVKGVPVDSAADVLSALAQSKKNDTVSISVIRDRRPLTISAKMLNDPGPAPTMMRGRGPMWHKRMMELFKDLPDPWQSPPGSGSGSTST